MKLAYSLFGLGPRSFGEVAKKADEAGFESIWMAEHLVFPETIPPTYPYTESGVPPVNPSTHLFDVWVSFGYMAALTSQIRFATNVFILPLRNPFATAKALATLDRLSGGRVLLGAGVGWLKEEFEAVGEDFANRGKRTDELIEVLRKLWFEPTIEHRGTFYDFGPVKFEPKPIQKPYIPIHIGGETPPAKRRAARLGDGWISAGSPSPEQAKAWAEEMARLRKDAGRGDSPFEITTGNGLDATIDNIRRYEDAGVDRMILRPPWPADGRLTQPYVLDFLSRVGEEIIPKLT